MVTLKENLKSVRHFNALVHRDALTFRAAAKRASTTVARHPDLTRPRSRRAVLRSGGRLIKTIETHGGRITTMYLWEVVLLVTCVEAYLHDALAAAARIDPSLMGPAAARSAAGPDEPSPEDNWADRWMRYKGPKGWAAELVMMGAPPYPEDVVSRLERMWGIRHVVVHRAGVADAAFVKRHPGMVTAVGARVSVSGPALETFIRALGPFVDHTDAYFLKRWPGLHAPSPATKTPRM